MASQWTANPALILRNHYTRLWLAVLAAGLMPLAWLALDAWNHALGINPLERLNYTTGIWSLNWLIATLAVTPLRRLLSYIMGWVGAAYGKRLSDWNGLIRLRRTMGLLCFFYTSLHATLYLWLQQDWDVAATLVEIAHQRHLLAGTLGLVLLIPLAATSTKAMMRRLGGNWKRLHRSVYLVGIAGVLHYVWIGKVGVHTPTYYASALAVLLIYRVLAYFGWLFQRPTDGGQEVAERPKILNRPE
jgi:sulfoxide reductase heme-binding subunit YedZ